MIITLEHFKASVIEKQCSQTHSVILLKKKNNMLPKDRTQTLMCLAFTLQREIKCHSYDQQDCYRPMKSEKQKQVMVIQLQELPFSLPPDSLLNSHLLYAISVGNQLQWKAGCGSYDAILAGLRYTTPHPPMQFNVGRLLLEKLKLSLADLP